MGKLQRDRGAAFEREIAGTLSAFLGAAVKRKLGQARDSGNDIDFSLAGRDFVVECKRRRRLGSVYQWLEQAMAALPHSKAYPMVVARGDEQPSVLIMHFNDFLHLLNVLTGRPTSDR